MYIAEVVDALFDDHGFAGCRRHGNTKLSVKAHILIKPYRDPGA